MKKENLIIGAILALFVLFIGSCKFKNPNVSQERIDTLRVKALFEKADKLKESNPDSALLIYDQVIHLIPAKANSFSVLHYLGLSYSKKAATYFNLSDSKRLKFNDSIAFSIASKIQDDQVIGLSYNSKGLSELLKGDYNKADSCFDKANAKAQKVNDLELQAKIFTNKAAIQYSQGNVDKTINYFQKAINLAKELKNDDLLAGNYMNIAMIYSDNGKDNLALSMYEKALGIYQQKKQTVNLILCYQNIGSIYYTRDQFDKALSVYQESLVLAQKINDQSNIGKAYHNIADVYSLMGSSKEAVDNYMKSIRIKEKLNNPETLTRDYISIGRLFLKQKDYLKAENYYEKALDISTKINSVPELARSYSSLGNVYQQQQNYRKAVCYYTKALDLFIKTDDKRGISDTYLYLGEANKSIGNIPQARQYFKKAIPIKEQLQDKDGLTSIYTELAQLCLATSQNNQALSYAQKSYALATNVRVIPSIAEACLTLKKVYNAMGDTKQALKYADLYTAYNDSLFSQQKTEAITNAEAQWHSEKKQQQIEKLEAQRKLNQATIDQKTAESKLQKTFIIAIVLLLLIVAIAFYVITNIRKRRDALYRKQLSDNISLKMQNARNSISPHFLFNMLSTISGMRNNPEMVETNTKKLSLLLRNVLENNDQTAIPLSKELETVSAFVDLQKLRIPEPFVVSFNVAEDVDTQTKVPAMIVQIPVENAIKHGLMPLQDRERRLSVNVSFENGRTKIIIENNGIGLKETNGQTAGTGTGLKVLLQTIHLLNEKNTGKILFSIKDKADLPLPERGTRVEIRIPADYSYNIN